jgi:asparagine synthase (glutamine-hydrolysing)
MCGFVGIFRIGSSESSIDSSVLTRMRDTMVHRGPDDAGIFVSPQQEIGLAHRRLSIIDLSPDARQPMSNQDESLWIVFNGEIYNHAEIRQELEASGLKFKTDHSDTEVILQGYAAWGEKVLSKLRGMFSFVIWDKKRGRLWMVRDRIGVKPLYYTFHNGFLLFASEIKALLAFPGIKPKVHEQALYDFLTFLVSPAPQTLFDGIFKLPAAHALTINKSGPQQVHRYWNPFHGHASLNSHSEDEWSHMIREQLKESIRYRMVSDVNFGVFLSGGIDSSANTAFMAELMNQPVDTFTVGFKEGPQEFNEMAYAKKMVDRHHTRHHEIMIGSEDMMQFLPKLIYHQDEPIADPVCVPLYHLSKLAKDNGTTVCQVGEGSDEMFCGYPYWATMMKWQQMADTARPIPQFLKKALYGVARGLSVPFWKTYRQMDLLRRLSGNEPMFWGGAEAFQQTHKSRLLSPQFRKRLGSVSSARPIQNIHNEFLQDAPKETDVLQWMAYLDLRLRLPELLLMRVDKMTMATSVESRVPFLDHKFVEMAMMIPKSIKYKNQTLKYILKKALEPVLPHDVIYRKKQGFGAPVNAWFQDRLGRWATQKILDFAKRTDIFDRDRLENFLAWDHTQRNWFLLNFVLWHEKWIENREYDGYF